MRDDTGPWDAPCVSLLVNKLDAARLINMAMGVNHGVNGAIVPAPNRGKGLACVSGLAVSINTNPAVVRMTVTQPQKYVVWIEMMF